MFVYLLGFRLVETNLVIVLSSVGGLLVVFGGGWVIYFCCTWKRKDKTPKDEANRQEDRLKEVSVVFFHC